MDGLNLMKHPGDVEQRLPMIMIAGHSDVTIAVRAMNARASDFVEKPPAYRRESQDLGHEENRFEVIASPGPPGNGGRIEIGNHH
jgi:DNA-binding NtrC family response regulator